MKTHTFKFIIIVFISWLFHSCNKKAVCENQTEPVIEISSNQILADGENEAKITVSIPGNASKDKRSISFKTSDGVFKESKSTTAVLEAVAVAGENCYFKSVATLVAPNSPGRITVTITINNETYTREIEALNSDAAKIKITLNSFSVKTGFGSDVNFTSRVSNIQNGNASSGYKVIFEDFYYNQKPVLGQFRELNTTTNELSKASGIYSPGFVPVDTFIYLKATLLDKTGTKTQIRDSVKLFIINNQ